MSRDALVDQVLSVWRRHDDIMLMLLDAVPRGGLAALPEGSRGRDVARQFFHVARVRKGWVHLHQTGKRPKLPRAHDGARPTKAQLRKELKESGKAVEAVLSAALTGGGKIRMFGGNPVRWMSYLVSHESHHRGLIALALKQSGKKLSDDVALDGLWKSWMSGKD